MKIISVRENPEYIEQTIAYFQKSWPKVSPILYQDSISNCLNAENPLPQWYILEKEGKFMGCAGLITNDFISRMDLYPWLCAVFIEESERGNHYSKFLIEKAKSDAQIFGFKTLNLCTNHIGFYEKFGFTYIGQGYHPWNEESRIYQIAL